MVNSGHVRAAAWTFFVSLFLGVPGYFYANWDKFGTNKTPFQWVADRGWRLRLILFGFLWFLLCATTALFVYWLMVVIARRLGKSSQPPSVVKGAARSELLLDDFDPFYTIRITINGVHSWRTLGVLEAPNLSGVVSDDPRVEVRVRNHKPLVDTMVYAGDHEVKIRDSRPTALPRGWDENWNDRAYELVDENQKPILQMALPSANHIDISGYFVKGAAKGAWGFERLFKYPSTDHPGELFSALRYLPLTAKSLYQLFLESCPSGRTGTGYKLQHVDVKDFMVEYFICVDLDVRSAHLNIFIPGPRDPEPVIRALAKEYKGFLDSHLKHGVPFVRVQPGDPPESAKGLVFTGVVNIYHERPLIGPDDSVELRDEFRKNEATLRLRGKEWEISQNSPLAQKG